ncbi:MAG: hypothetical protein JWN41_1228 [Thermoleophilia bacterium]|nr:hypothetical protein [Thermoleophilia bacterium]
MVANGPGFLPKTALVASRIVYYPFTIPQKLNDSATLTGGVLNAVVGTTADTMGKAYEALQPRGPAKWLTPLFGKVAGAAAHSQEIATRNKTVFWDPFSQGAEGIGRAIAGPGAYWYLKKAGMEQPTEDAIKGVLNMGLFKFPEAGPAPAPDGPPAPAPDQGPAPEPGPAPAPEGPAPEGPAPAPDGQQTVAGSGSAPQSAAEGAGNVQVASA